MGPVADCEGQAKYHTSAAALHQRPILPCPIAWVIWTSAPLLGVTSGLHVVILVGIDSGQGGGMGPMPTVSDVKMMEESWRKVVESDVSEAQGSLACLDDPAAVEALGGCFPPLACLAGLGGGG